MNVKLILILLFFGSAAYGQSFEIGLFGGASNYRGDLAPHLVPKEFHPAGGVFIKKNLSPFFSWNTGARFGTISGSDANFEYLEDRGLKFSSILPEVYTVMEFNFFPFLKSLKRKQYTPFVFSGISGFYFDPIADFKGQKFHLRELTTEGQGLSDERPSPYGKFNLAVPVGGGIKLAITRNIYLSYEISYRISLTDYLDDVGTTYFDNETLYNRVGQNSAFLADRSAGKNPDFAAVQGKQRGNSQTWDYYFFTGITLSFVFDDSVCFSF